MDLWAKHLIGNQNLGSISSFAAVPGQTTWPLHWRSPIYDNHKQEDKASFLLDIFCCLLTTAPCNTYLSILTSPHAEPWTSPQTNTSLWEVFDLQSSAPWVLKANYSFRYIFPHQKGYKNISSFLLPLHIAFQTWQHFLNKTHYFSLSFYYFREDLTSSFLVYSPQLTSSFTFEYYSTEEWSCENAGIQSDQGSAMTAAAWECQHFLQLKSTQQLCKLFNDDTRKK